MPDYQGLFLRGRGSYDAARVSGALGVVQEDAMRPITGWFQANTWDNVVFTVRIIGGNLAPGSQGNTLDFNSARLGPHYAGTETRPANMAVRYLVRAMH